MKFFDLFHVYVIGVCFLALIWITLTIHHFGLTPKQRRARKLAEQKPAPQVQEPPTVIQIHVVNARRLQLGPNDILAIEFPQPISQHYAKALEQHITSLREKFGIEGCIVFDSGATCKVISKKEVEDEQPPAS